MGLGSTGFKDFKPNKSRTATQLLKVTPQATTKKDQRLEIRIEDDLYQCFNDICKLNDVNMSMALRAYIEDVVERGAL